MCGALRVRFVGGELAEEVVLLDRTHPGVRIRRTVGAELVGIDAEPGAEFQPAQ